MPSVLFVCTANVCRSPMASAIFRRVIEQSGTDLTWKVESAGTWAVEGAPASIGSVEVMSNRGLDIRNHEARNVTADLLAKFDLVLTMEDGHKEALKAEFPEFAEKIYLLSETAGYTHEIRDPIGGPLSDYEAAARELTQLLEEGFERIESLAGKGQT